MGPWASVVVALAAIAGAFFALMGFRGLMETLDEFSGQCADCGRVTLVPLPPQSHRCRRCHYGELRLANLLTRRERLHH